MAKRDSADALREDDEGQQRGRVMKETDDIFREVEEELRKERLEKLWEQYGTYVAAVALAIVLGVGGFKLYEYTQNKRAAEAGARFNSALIALDSKQPQEAEKALKDLGATGQGGYRALARMRLAALEQPNGRTEEAVKAYDAIAADNGVDQLIRGLAGIRAAMLRIDTADFTEMQNRLTPLKDAKNPWAASAKELLGLAAWKAGKLTEAEQEYQSLVETRQTPQGIRQRAEMMLALLLDAGKTAGAPAAETSAPAATASPQPAANDKNQSSAPAPKGGAPKGGQK